MTNKSGRFVLRLPPPLHRRLTSKASDHGVSLNQLCVSLLISGMEGKEGTSPWDTELEKITVLLRQRFGGNLHGIILFGSRISGEENAHSDLDVLVVVGNAVPLTRSLYSWWDSHISPKGMEINPHFVHCPKETDAAGSIWFEMALNHKVVYQRGRLMAQTIEKLLAAVGENKIGRSWSNGHPYWVWRDHAEQETG